MRYNVIHDIPEVGDFICRHSEPESIDDLFLCVTKNSMWIKIVSTSKYNLTDSFIKQKYEIVKQDKDLISEFLDNTTFYIEIKPIITSFINNKYPDLIDKVKSKRCAVCGQILSIYDGIDLRRYSPEKNEIICNDCFNKIYSVCDRCGNAFKKGDGDENLCKECAKRNYILPYHRYNPKLKFFGNNKDNSAPYLGVELEVDEGGKRDKNAVKVMNTINKNKDMFVYCMSDGSLNDGFEIITQPATLKYHTSIKGIYQKAFDELISMGYLSHDTNTCGLHVHFNRDFYRDDEELYVTRLLYLVDKFWDDVVRFSRRNERRMKIYSKKVDKPIPAFYKESNRSEDHEYHYYAVNLSNQNTIEFRMFKGTLNIETFMATLQFVNNCIICAKEKNAEEIQSMNFEDLISGRACKSYWNRRKNLRNTEE